MRTILLASCLLIALMPGSTFAAEDPAAIPAWLKARLEASGIEATAADIQVVRTVQTGASVETFEVPLASLPEALPGTQVAAPAAPDVFVGELLQHLMVQSSCAGYGAQAVAVGLTRIQGASWDTGVHIALGPTGGGVAVDTASDPTSPVIAMTDTGMTAAAGSFTIHEDRIAIFGSCLLLIGTMSGTGAIVFK